MNNKIYADITPKEAIRKQCIECVGGIQATKACGGDVMIGQGDSNGVCYFFRYRQGKGRPSVKIIRKFCLECMGGSYMLVANCTTQNCPLHQYRFGKHPKHASKKGNFTQEVVCEPA